MYVRCMYDEQAAPGDEQGKKRHRQRIASLHGSFAWRIVLQGVLIDSSRQTPIALPCLTLLVKAEAGDFSFPSLVADFMFTPRPRDMVIGNRIQESKNNFANHTYFAKRSDRT